MSSQDHLPWNFSNDYSKNNYSRKEIDDLGQFSLLSFSDRIISSIQHGTTLTVDDFIHHLWRFAASSHFDEESLKHALYSIDDCFRNVQDDDYWNNLYKFLKKNEELCYFILMIPEFIKLMSISLKMEKRIQKITCHWFTMLSMLRRDILIQRLGMLYNVEDADFLNTLWERLFPNFFETTFGEKTSLEFCFEAMINMLRFSRNQRKVLVLSNWIKRKLDQQNEDCKSCLTCIVIFVLINEDQQLEDLLKLISKEITEVATILKSICKEFIVDDTNDSKFRVRAFSFLSFLEGPTEVFAKNCVKIMENENLWNLRIMAANFLSEIIIAHTCSQSIERVLLAKILQTLFSDPQGAVRRSAFEGFCDAFTTNKSILPSQKICEILLSKGIDKDKRLRNMVLQWLDENFCDIPNASEITMFLFKRFHKCDLHNSYHIHLLQLLVDKLIQTGNCMQLYSLDIEVLKKYEYQLLNSQNLSALIRQDLSSQPMEETDLENEMILEENLL